MIYITGDTHGDFKRFEAFCAEKHPTAQDVMILLGDAGLNLKGGERDRAKKEYAASFGFTFFCIHGNHEMRPEDVGTYRTREFCGGTVWYEEEYPNLLFAKDGEIYRFGSRDCIVIGGAYSTDKPFRLALGWVWFENEQPSEETKALVERRLAERGNEIDVVLSHTCPMRYFPFPRLDPEEAARRAAEKGLPPVDRSTEEWLDTLCARVRWGKWYCGHYHVSKTEGDFRIFYEDIDVFCE